MRSQENRSVPCINDYKLTSKNDYSSNNDTSTTIFDNSSNLGNGYHSRSTETSNGIDAYETLEDGLDNFEGMVSIKPLKDTSSNNN